MREAKLVSNPGCYATAATLAVLPLLKAGLIEPGTLIIDAKSGTTGAGRRANEEMSFSEVADDLRAYRILKHQHTPEIERTLGMAGIAGARVTFTPHLLPVRRGILATAYGRLRAQKSRDVVVPIAAYAGAGQPMGESATMDTTTEMPEDAASRSELRRALERKVDELPEQFRAVFILREVEEMSAEEAAECLGIPVATVRTRAFRARALLRESLAREMDIATINAFGFAGDRCDRIVARVLARLETIRSSGSC